MKEHAAQHDEHAFAIGVGNANTEDGSVNLRLLDVLPDGIGRHTFECCFYSIDYFCHDYTFRKDCGLIHSPFSYWNL
jgi:hypothetical protein